MLGNYTWEDAYAKIHCTVYLSLGASVSKYASPLKPQLNAYVSQPGEMVQDKDTCHQTCNNFSLIPGIHIIEGKN